MRTNYIWSLIAVLIFSVSEVFGQSGTNTLTVPDITSQSGREVLLPLSVANSDEIVALQFTVKVPAGCTINTASATLTERKDDHVVRVKNMASGSYMVMVYSPSNKPLKGRMGKVLTLAMQIPDSCTEGASYPFGLSNVVLSRADGTNALTDSVVGRLFIAKSPDLSVTDVVPSETTLKPGGNISVSWAVKNVGGLSTTGGWSEQVSLVAADGSTVLLGTSYYTDALAAGGSVSRNVSYVLPLLPGVDGTVKVQVRLIPNADSGEKAEMQGNNTAYGSTTVNVAKQLSLVLPSSGVDETLSTPVKCQISRSGSWVNEQVVTLTTNGDKRVTVPSTVTIPAGQSGSTFYITLTDNKVLDSDSTVILTASTDGYEALKSSFVIVDDEHPAFTVSSSNTDLTEGDAFQLTIKAGRASAKPVNISLSCDNASRFSFPSQVTLPAGETEVKVNVTAVDDEQPALTLSAEFTASAAGYDNGSAIVLLKDNDLPEISLSFAPNSVSESSGISAVVATLKRVTNKGGKLTVKLSDDSNGGIYYSSSTVTMESGVNEMKFTIGVIDNANVDGNRDVNITAAIYLSSCNCSATGTTAGVFTTKLSILDDDGPSLKLLSPMSTWLEGSKTGSITVKRNTAVTNALTLQLTSDHDADLTYNHTVTIPAGQVSVDVPVSVVTNSTSDDDRTVVFTATADGFTDGKCWVFVTDQTQPDARIAALTLSKTDVEVGGQTTASISVANDGATALPAQTPINIYCSGQSTVLGVAYTQETLEPGQTTIALKTLTLSSTPGSYTLNAVVNEDKSVKELLYVNNRSANVTVNVLPGFHATLKADKKIYKQGETVSLSGTATGSKAVRSNVEIYIIKDGVRQTLTATTDATGKFTTLWTPYATQAGHFILGACYPGENLTTLMDSVDIYGMRLTSSDYVKCETLAGQSYSGTINLTNSSTLKLTNVKATVLSAPANCKVTFDPVNEIEGQATVGMNYTLLGSSPTEGNDWEQIKVRITSAEGTTVNQTLYYFCRSAQAQLKVDMERINTTMTKGQSRDYPITITNVGKGSTGKITLALPQLGWLTAATPLEMPSLVYGESTTVVLRFTPTADMTLNVPVTGNLAINCANGDGISLPFSVEPVSESKGTLVVDVTDEYTFYTSAAPHVAGADVVIKHPTTGVVLQHTVTDANGKCSMELPEGQYAITVTEKNHNTYNNTLTVDAGKETTHKVFISFNAISYTFNVVETEVKDEYQVETVVKYETRVPKPVVVVDFPKDLRYRNQILNIVATNKGLISAYNVHPVLPKSTNGVSFKLLSEPNIPELRAQECTVFSIEMKVDNEALFDYPSSTILTGGTIYDSQNITDTQNNAGVKRHFAPSGGSVDSTHCVSFSISIIDDHMECDPNTGKPIKTGVTTSTKLWSYGTCGNGNLPTGGGFPIPYLPYWGGGGGLSGPYNPNPQKSDPNVNKPTENKAVFDGCLSDCSTKLLKAIGDCLDAPLGCVDLSPKKWGECIKDFVKDCAWDYIETTYLEKDKYEYTDCVKSAMSSCGKLAPFLGCALGISDCLNDLIDYYFSCKKDNEKAPGLHRAPAAESTAEDTIWEGAKMVQQTFNAYYQDLLAIYGDSVWLNMSSKDFYNMSLSMDSHLDKDGYFVPGEDRYACKPQNISNAEFDKFVARWNNTIDLDNKKITSSDNSVDYATLEKNDSIMHSFDAKSKEFGYADFSEMTDSVTSYFDRMIEKSKDLKSSSVCASITLKFAQSMTMTRQAFRGTLTVFNGNKTTEMKDVKLNLEIRDKAGNLATAKEFQVNAESLDEFTGNLDFTSGWTLAAGATGTVTVLFIPTKYAAPDADMPYQFGGTLSYLDPFTGLEVTRSLAPVTLTVKPSPNLDLTYFMQRDVMGDDPLTPDVVEPSQLAEFALLINNTGNGNATNVNMTTAQPEITDNEKGLAIRFELLSAQLNGADKTLALGGSTATDFGNIAAHSTVYAQWWLQCSLLGHFNSYNVSATHLTSYGNSNLSLLDTVSIHELIHSLSVPQADGKNLVGFLTNDIADNADTPDMLYLTDGTTQSVATARSAIFTKNSDSEYQLKIIPNGSGWNYVNISDPTGGRQTLTGIVRQSDGKTISLHNFWQTSCTMRDSYDPLYENRLHLADLMTNGEQTYVLTFTPKPDVTLAVARFKGVPASGTSLSAPLNTLDVVFNKAIKSATFTADDISFCCQGKTADASGVSIVQKDDTTYTLDLSKFAAFSGYCVLTVQTNGITDVDGFNGETGKQASWVQYPDGKLGLTVQASPANGGTVTPAISRQTYGSTVKLTATPAEGFMFNSWNLGNEQVSTDAEYSCQLNSDAAYTAIFTPKRLNVTVSYDAAGGSVSGAGTGIYNYGDVLQLSASPSSKYTFDGWKVNGVLSGTDAELQITLKAATTVEAVFTLIPDHTELTLNYDLHKGWNWLSFNVTNDNMSMPILMFTPITDQLVTIEGQYGNLTHFDEGKWSGNLQSIQYKQSYKLNVNTDTKYTLQGMSLKSDEETITLEDGWNWVGYTPTLGNTLDEALTYWLSEPGDVVKGQDGFAVYNGTSWIGSLKTIQPGKGYLFRSKGVKSFSYPTPDEATAPKDDTGNVDNTLPWSYDQHLYSDNEAVVAQVVSDKVTVEPNRYVVGAFVGDECRGISSEIDGLLFITIHGEVGDQVSFRLFDRQDNKVYTLPETANVAGQITGSLATPLRLSLDVATGIHSLGDGDLSVYPVPVKTLLYVKGDIDADARIDITDMGGLLCIRQRGLTAEHAINVTSLKAGIYVITIHTKNAVYRTKFTKE